MILVLGLGVSGKSACEFLLNKGKAVTAIDDNSDIFSSKRIRALEKKGLKCLKDKVIESVRTAEYVLVSPGISLQHRVIQEARKHNIPILSELEIGLEKLAKPKIAITGTNGKTTVSTLIVHLLKQYKIKALAVGNIGLCVTDSLVQNGDYDVLIVEVSSFQINLLQQALFDTGIILNITPDHLDRYSSLLAYAQAKFSLERYVKNKQGVFIHENLKKQFPQYVKPYHHLFGKNPQAFVRIEGDNILFKERIMYFLPSKYSHRIDFETLNILSASIACYSLDLKDKYLLQHVESFSKPPHRLEYVRTIKDIEYFNDSKATNVDAVTKAVEAMQKPVHLILGGRSKGHDFSIWKPIFYKKVKSAIVFGESSSLIKEALGQKIKLYTVDNLYEALRKAKQLAISGEVVLFSPGCSSFDMFNNFEHRGDCFKQIVHRL